MKQNYLLFLFILLTVNNIQSQSKEYSRWYFGYNAGINFNTNPPNALTNGLLNTWEGCSSLCDTNGNIVLYSDGVRFYNKDNTICKNGNDDQFTTYLNSSTSACAIVKHPLISNELFLFHAPLAGYESDGYKYSIYDIANDTINPKYLPLITQSSEKIAVIDHPNGIDKIITIKQHNNNSYYSYVLTKNGLNTCPIISNSGSVQGPSSSSGQGFMKYSFDGSYIANAMMGDVEKIQLFKVKAMGKFELYSSISSLFRFGYGIEFSHNNKYLYYTVATLDSSCLYQYEISTGKKITIKNWPNLDKQIFALQMGQDGKIYVANPDSLYLGVINNPENYGLACNFVSKGFYLGGKKSAYGLPTMNQSYFYTPSINFKYQIECISNSVNFWGHDTFNARVHQWELRKLNGGNWQSIGQDKNLMYTFTDTGMYEVRYGAAINSRQDTVSKIIHIYPKINKHFLGNDTIYTKGTPFKKQLSAPYGMHCQLWQDSTGLSTYQADTSGRYTCKVTNQSFCEVTDTIEIKECINSLTVPSIFRIKDSLYTYQQVADSFIWFKNNVQFKITKASAIKLTDTGTYRVEAAKKDNCKRSSANFRIEKLSLHKLNSQAIGIKIYPNPANEKVFIEASTDFSLLVTDATGKTILEAENIKEITLANGIYYFRLTVHNTSYFEKVVVLN